jgi:hypothetical protein
LALAEINGSHKYGSKQVDEFQLSMVATRLDLSPHGQRRSSMLRAKTRISARRREIKPTVPPEPDTMSLSAVGPG